MAEVSPPVGPPRSWRYLAKEYQRLTIRALDRLGAVQLVIERMHDEAGHPGDSAECELSWCRDLNEALSDG